METGIRSVKLAVLVAAMSAMFAAAGNDATIRVVQWNIGHFAMGRNSRTAISPEDSGCPAGMRALLSRYAFSVTSFFSR